MTHLFGYAYYPTLCIIDSVAPLRIPNSESVLIKLFIIHQRSDFIIHHSLERPSRDLIAASLFIISNTDSGVKEAASNFAFETASLSICFFGDGLL